MRAPRIITCADAGYFHFLPHLEANVERKFGRLPLVYSLGLTEAQAGALRSEVVRVDVPAGFAGRESRRGFVMATHKPACIRDALDRSGGEGCLCIDADIFFVEPLRADDIGDADMAVTPRHPKERTPLHLENGNLNSGFVYVSDRPAARAMLARWEEACAEGTRTDQKALSDLLAGFGLLEGLGPVTRDGLALMRLDPRLFNDVRLKTGRVLHFKNAGRDPRIAAKLHRYRRWEERHPHALAAYFRLRRALGV